MESRPIAQPQMVDEVVQLGDEQGLLPEIFASGRLGEMG
jgi:hypothetical protein